MDYTDREFHRVVNEGLVPMLKDSSIAVSVCPGRDAELDAKFCVELGAMIMLDKPILALIAPGETCPPKLALVADEIVEADLNTDEGQEALHAALNRMSK